MYFVERFCKKGENDLENTIYLTLMNKDKPVINLSGKIKEDLKRIKLPVFVADKAEIIEENKKFLPVFIHSAEISTELFNKWFAKRVLSDKRRDFPSKIEWQDEFPHFFSLTDHYWLRYDETEKYSDLNFFDNGYKTLTGDTFFTKNIPVLNPAQLYFHSPDITANGNMSKRWKRNDNKIDYLIKRSGNKQEVLNEVFATWLLNKLNIVTFVAYSLCIEKYDICSMCRNFVTKDTEFVPAAHVYEAVPFSDEIRDLKTDPERTYAHLIESIKYFNIPGGAEFVDKMLIADEILMNDDRHLNNFGFLRDVNTAEFIEPAPLFDFGNTFFNDTGEHNRNKLLFADRIQYLYKEKRIQPLTKEQYSEFAGILDECPFVGTKKTKEILNEFKENNERIKKKILIAEHDKSIGNND